MIAAPANDDSTDEPKIPSKFSRKGKDLSRRTVPPSPATRAPYELDVAVLDNKGHFLPGIPKSNFRVLEDNVPQKIASFNMNSDAPMTIAMVIEFSNLFQQYWSARMVRDAGGYLRLRSNAEAGRLRGVVAYDLRTEILSDFTNDRAKIQDAMQRLRIPGFSEANLFDAVVDTEQRMATSKAGRRFC